MSHRAAKLSRRAVKKETRKIQQASIKQVMESAWYKRAWFGWRITDQSPLLSARLNPARFSIQYKKAWSFQFTIVPLSWHRPNKQIINGWHAKFLWFAIDWRKGL